MEIILITRMNLLILFIVIFISHPIPKTNKKMLNDYLIDDNDIGLDTQKLTNEEKPAESFAQLIKMAIESSSRQRLFLTEIYNWILETYPYYRRIDQGWRVHCGFYYVFLLCV